MPAFVKGLDSPSPTNQGHRFRPLPDLRTRRQEPEEPNHDSGQGGNSCVTVASALITAEIHEDAMSTGFGGVEMRYALARKYPNAETHWPWQYVFPASKPSTDPRSGTWRRHYLDKTTLQKAGGQGNPRSGHHQARQRAHISPYLRHRVAAGRIRYPHGPGTPGPQEHHPEHVRRKKMASYHAASCA